MDKVILADIKITEITGIYPQHLNTSQHRLRAGVRRSSNKAAKIQSSAKAKTTSKASNTTPNLPRPKQMTQLSTQHGSLSRQSPSEPSPITPSPPGDPESNGTDDFHPENVPTMSPLAFDFQQELPGASLPGSVELAGQWESPSALSVSVIGVSGPVFPNSSAHIGLLQQPEIPVATFDRLVSPMPIGTPFSYVSYLRDYSEVDRVALTVLERVNAGLPPYPNES